MDFSITEEQRDLLIKLDEFCAQNLFESEIQRWADEGGVPDSFMRKYYREGFGKIGLPVRMGGTPASIMTRVLLLERLARHAGATLPAQSLMTYTHFVSQIANDDQMALLRDITEETGKVSFSFAVTEPQSGSKNLDVRTTAVQKGDSFIINGAKSFVSSGQFAPYIVLIARDVSLDEEDADGFLPLTFFLVSRDTKGVDTFPMMKAGQHLIPMADITFDNVCVGQDAVMGQRGRAAVGLLSSFSYGRVYICATTVGMAQSAFEQALSFALDRDISGSTVFSFQQIQTLITNMQIKIDSMRSMLYKTACKLDQDDPDAFLDVALLKRYVPKTAMEVADSAMQIMGGLGYQSATKAARVWQECRGNRIAQGTDEVMTVIAAKRIAKRYSAERQDPPTWRF